MERVDPSILVEIPTYEWKDGVVFYNVLLRKRNSLERSWTVNRRFKEFDVLHSQMQEISKNVPPLPKKTFFKMKKAENLEKRRNDLEKFCIGVLTVKELFNSENVQTFFDIASNSPAPSIKSPVPLITLKEPIISYPVKQLAWDEKNALLITVEKDIKKTSSDSGMPQSFLRLIRCTDSKNFSDPKPFCIIKYIEKIGCMAYNISKCMIVCGTYSGLVYTYSLSLVDSTVKEKAKIKAHNSRVRGIAVDESDYFLISIGDDKKVVGMTNDGKILFSSQLGDSPLTHLAYFSSSEEMIVANFAGEIIFCDLQLIKLREIAKFAPRKDKEIKSLIVDKVHNLIFIGYPDGEILWTQFVGEERGRLLGTISLESPISTLAWCPALSELLAGTPTGFLKLVWLSSGECLSDFKCHSSAVSGLVFSPELVLSASKDSSVSIWKLFNPSQGILPY